MMDPVVASDGFTYEKVEIEKWIDNGNRTSPPSHEDKNSRVGRGAHRVEWPPEAAEVTSRTARHGIHPKGTTRRN